jgi:hypothetical protein
MTAKKRRTKKSAARPGALMTTSVAILVPAPGRFSITNCWASRSDSHWPIRRAMMSLPPPGGNAHRPRRIGLRPRDARDGRERGSAAARCRNFRRESFIEHLSRAIDYEDSYSALMPASLMIGHHFSISAFW